MTLPVVAIRPEPGCSTTVAAGREAGLAITPCPLFEVRPVAWTAPSPDEIDALLIGSANAIRHGGPALEAFRDKPVYAVGEATAAIAREAGFVVAGVGRGGLQGVLDNTASLPPRLLRIAGRERITLEPPAGVTITLRVAYDSVALPLRESLAAVLRSGALVLLHSAAAARHLAAECDRCGVPRSAVSLAALGPRIAAAAGPGWAGCAQAREPNEAALLALAQDLCHDAQI